MNGWSSYWLVRISLNVQLPHWLALASLEHGSLKVDSLSWLAFPRVSIPRDTNRSKTFLWLHNECHTIAYTGPVWVWYRAGPCGAPGHKSLSVSPISWLQERGFIQPPWPSLSSNSRFKQLLIREGRGCGDKGGIVKRYNSATLGKGPGPPSRDIHNNTFELFCRYWNPHQVGEINSMLPTSM